MDGVVTDIAGLHAAAWKNLFDSTPPPLAGAGDVAPFTVEADYYAYVDGRSREDGVGAFLASRNLRPPQGSAGDPPGTLSVQWVAARNSTWRRSTANWWRSAKISTASACGVGPHPSSRRTPERSPTPPCERPHQRACWTASP